LEPVKTLVEGSADIEAKVTGSTALLWALLFKRVKIVKYLVGVGAKLDAVDEEGRNSFLVACAVGNVEIVCYLEEAGASTTARDGIGMSALHTAVNGGSVKVLKQLLKWGFFDVNDVVAGAKGGRTPLLAAINKGSVRMVQLLVKAGADVTGKSDAGGEITPVLAAACTDVPDVMEEILKAGGDLTATMWGMNLLQIAMQMRKSNMVGFLLRQAEWPKEDVEKAREFVGG
jgi:ankyrin repeat protein